MSYKQLRMVRNGLRNEPTQSHHTNKMAKESAGLGPVLPGEKSNGEKSKVHHPALQLEWSQENTTTRELGWVYISQNKFYTKVQILCPQKQMWNKLCGLDLHQNLMAPSVVHVPSSMKFGVNWFSISYVILTHKRWWNTSTLKRLKKEQSKNNTHHTKEREKEIKFMVIDPDLPPRCNGFFPSHHHVCFVLL